MPATCLGSDSTRQLVRSRHFLRMQPLTTVTPKRGVAYRDMKLQPTFGRNEDTSKPSSHVSRGKEGIGHTFTAHIAQHTSIDSSLAPKRLPGACKWCMLPILLVLHLY